METPSERSATERFRRADAVFDTALDLPLDEQAAYVRRACAGDPVLCADVERLLRAHSRSDGFLSEPAGDRAALLLVDSRIASDVQPIPVPDRIGPYRISREIGHGGMGVVYLAERDDPDFAQRVALKVVRAPTADGRTYVARFLTERRVLASLEHPHIARLFDSGVTTDGLPYYTMAYCEGGSLAQRLAADGRLTIDEALRVARQLASALGAAHARGVVHRDVKPANILFDADGSVRLSDFGVAKLLEDDSTRSAAVLGSVAYLAPEQVRGEAIDHRADLWALGVTLYEMISGRRPFVGPSYAAVMHAIVTSEPEPIRRLVPDIPAAAEALVARLLQKDAASRPESAAAVLQALNGGDTAVTGAARGVAPPAKTGRHRRMAAAIGSAVVLVGVVTGYVALRPAATRSETTLAGGAVASPAIIPSVVVRPFVTIGDASDTDPFADGLTEELVTTLGKVRGLRVIARSSVFALKGSSLGTRAIADTLGVDNVIEGSVREAGGRRRISVQLVRARDQSVLWSEEYGDRELTDVVDVQEQIARSVTAALQVHFALEHATPLSADAEALDLYLRGRSTMNSGRQNLRRAARYFRAAIALDSTFARAYSGLSDAYTSLANFGYDRPGPASDTARKAALRALALDSTLAEARTSLAHALCTHDFDWDASEREFKRAIDYDPGYTYARTTYAICLETQARFADAIAQLDTARSRDPFRRAIGTVLGRVYVNAGRPDDAIRTLTQTLERTPDSDMAWQQLGHAYLAKGMSAEAIAAFNKAAALSGIRDSAHLAYAFAVTGDRAMAERMVRELVGSQRRRYVPPFHIAMVYAALGRVNDAFAWLDKAYAERASFLNGVKVDPAFKSLHGDPRWTVLLAKMHLDR